MHIDHEHPGRSREWFGEDDLHDAGRWFRPEGPEFKRAEPDVLSNRTTIVNESSEGEDSEPGLSWTRCEPEIIDPSDYP